MKPQPSSLARVLIRLTYLLPALFGLVMLIVFFVPHVFFTFNGKIQPTLSPFELMRNTWESTFPMLSASATGSSTVYFFSLTMVIVTVLSWICVLAYALMAIASAICSTVAFSHAPTDRLTNRAKRWMHFFCPNRILYVITHLLLLLPASFPYLLEHFYRTQLGYNVKAFFLGASDPILVAVLVLIAITAFLALLPAQAREQTDMYRFFKSTKEKDEET